MASISGGGGGGNDANGASAPFAGAPPHRSCESCNSAPAIPFCRVEWSYLCTGCGPVVHRDSWIIPMPPFIPNLNQAIHYPFMVPNHDGGGTPVKRKRRRRSKEEMAEIGQSERAESVIRYKEKRKTRQLNKTTRSETEQTCAEIRQSSKSTGEEPKMDEMESIVGEMDSLPPVVDPIEEVEEQ